MEFLWSPEKFCGFIEIHTILRISCEFINFMFEIMKVAPYAKITKK